MSRWTRFNFAIDNAGEPIPQPLVERKLLYRVGRKHVTSRFEIDKIYLSQA